MLGGSGHHCIKDLLFHIACVQDGWIHEDILRVEPVLASDGALKNTEGGPAYAGFALKTLVDYWKAVEQSTLAYLSTLTNEELKRIVAVHDSPAERFTVNGLRWHVMIHEMQHTAQIANAFAHARHQAAFIGSFVLLAAGGVRLVTLPRGA